MLWWNLNFLFLCIVCSWTCLWVFYIIYYILYYVILHHITLYCICVFVFNFMSCVIFVCVLHSIVILCRAIFVFLLVWLDCCAIIHCYDMFHIISHAGCVIDLWNVCSENVNVIPCWLVIRDDMKELASSIYRAV